MMSTQTLSTLVDSTLSHKAILQVGSQDLFTNHINHHIISIITNNRNTVSHLKMQSVIDLYRQQVGKSKSDANTDTSDDGSPRPKRAGHWEFRPGFEEVRTCVGKSFAGTEDIAGEPLVAWCCSHLKKLDWYTSELHQESCTFIMGFPIYDDLSKKDTLVVAKKEYNDNTGTAGELASVAIVMEYDPSKQEPNLFSKLLKLWQEMMAFLSMWQSGPLPTLFTNRSNKDAAKACEKRGKTLISLMEKSHKEEGPQYPHWYVHMVAVHPSYHGKGYGRELMEKVNELADNESAVQYLECGIPNVKFYEKMGYEVQSIKTVVDPIDPTAEPGKGVIMMRKPQT